MKKNKLPDNTKFKDKKLLADRRIEVGERVPYLAGELGSKRSQYCLESFKAASVDEVQNIINLLAMIQDMIDWIKTLYIETLIAKTKKMKLDKIEGEAKKLIRSKMGKD